MITEHIDPIPQRKGAGKRNMDLFLLGSKSAPVCFYFEDEGAEELYSRFLTRLFPKYRAPFVVCTGGKTKKDVLAEAAQHNLSPVVFVQDKDFDDLIGVISTDPRVVTLNRYSYENYLLDPAALVEIAIESKRRLRRKNAMELLQIDSYLDELYTSYRPLASLFIVARRLNLKGVKTTKQSVFDLVGENDVIVTDESVERFMAVVVSAALKLQKIEAPDGLRESFESALVPPEKYRNYADKHSNSHLCGKHLLDLTLRYVDSKIGSELSSVDRFEIAMRLTLHLSLEAFDRVRGAIRESVSGQSSSEEAIALLN